MKKHLNLIFALCLLLLCSSFVTKKTSSKTEGKELHYIALVLDSASSAKLKDFAVTNMPWQKDDYKMYCHHMTLGHYTNTTMTEELYLWAKAHEGKRYTLSVTDFGHSDKAFAVKVKCKKVKSKNAIKHVTMATHTSANGAQVDSNYILDWIPMSKPMKLTGVVTIYYKE